MTGIAFLWIGLTISLARGVGKTVLLVKIDEIASKEGFHTISVEAHEGKNLADLVAPGLRKVLLSLSTVESAKELGRKGLRVFRSLLGAVKLKVNDIELGLTISPEIGVADSGDLEADLPELLVGWAKPRRPQKALWHF